MPAMAGQMLHDLRPRILCGLLVAGAGRAQPDQGEVREAGLVAEPLADERADVVQLGRVDGAHVVAALAGDVLARALARGRVEGGAVAEVNVADESRPLERLEVPVDGGQV